MATTALDSKLPPLYTIQEVIDLYLEEIEPTLAADELRTQRSVLSFFRSSLHSHGSTRLGKGDKKYMQSFLGPGNFYSKSFSQIFGPSKIEGGVYYYVRRYYATGSVHVSKELCDQVPRIMRTFCDWLAREGYVREPIVEPFERYDRALKRDAAQRRRGVIPLSDRQSQEPYCEDCAQLGRDAQLQLALEAETFQHIH